MVEILDLPVEVLLRVHRMLDDPKDRAQLVATCQQIRTVLSAASWRNVVLTCNVEASRRTKPVKKQLVRFKRKPYLVKHLSDPLTLSGLGDHHPPMVREIGNDYKLFDEFCQSAVARGFYDKVFEWVQTLTIELDNADQVGELGEQHVDLVHWFLTFIVPKFTNLRLLQLDARLSDQVGALNDTILPNCFGDGWKTGCYNLSLTSRVNQRIELTRTIQFLRLNLCSTQDTSAVKLPYDLRRLDLMFDKGAPLSSLQLQKMLVPCRNSLQALTMGNARLTDHTLAWVPPGITELSLQNTATKGYFLIPEQTLHHLTFLHLYSNGTSGPITKSQMETIAGSFPNMTTLYIEKFRIDLELMWHLRAVLPQLDNFMFLDMIGNYFEESDLASLLHTPLSTVAIGQCHFANSDYVEALKITHRFQLIRVGISIDCPDADRPKHLVRIIKMLARLTSKLHIDLQVYRWNDTVQTWLSQVGLCRKIKPRSVVAAREQQKEVLLYEVDLELVWNRYNELD